jgi:hypothetical protein
MTRKSAFTIAGGIAVALVAGLVAVSINMGIMRASGDPAGPGRLSPNPIVKTEIRTVQHKVKPAKDDGQVKTVVLPRPTTAVPSTAPSSSGWHESEHESEHQFGEQDDD